MGDASMPDYMSAPMQSRPSAGPSDVDIMNLADHDRSPVRAGQRHAGDRRRHPRGRRHPAVNRSDLSGAAGRGSHLCHDGRAPASDEFAARVFALAASDPFAWAMACAAAMASSCSRSPTRPSGWPPTPTVALPPTSMPKSATSMPRNARQPPAGARRRYIGISGGVGFYRVDVALRTVLFLVTGKLDFSSLNPRASSAPVPTLKSQIFQGNRRIQWSTVR